MMDEGVDPMRAKVPPPADVVAALKKSGFPFQTAVQHVIETAPGWRVHEAEYGWETSTGETRYLDLIATNGTIYLTVECKKTAKEKLIYQ
jgi:hypothetical protein